MKNIKSMIVAGYLMCFAFTAGSQNNSCLEEILAIEKSNSPFADSSLYAKNIFMNYVVKATNWDNETNVSNVRLYKQKENMNFFSEQANIYQDENDAYIILPVQKIIIISSTVKGASKRRPSEEFMDMRKEFLDSCEVVKCTEINPNTKTRLLVLKNKSEDIDDVIKIKTMTYEYNPVLKKIVSVKIDYNEDYKLKQLTVVYKDMSTESTHEFPAVRRIVTDKKGKLLPKYKDYELVDNRDQKTNSKKSR